MDCIENTLNRTSFQPIVDTGASATSITAVTAPKPAIITFSSPKGGVGATTLTIQLAETFVHHEQQQVVLIDMDLPYGNIANSLHLFPRHDILELLEIPTDYITLNMIDEFALRYRDNLFLIPAPGRLLTQEIVFKTHTFAHVLQTLTKGGFNVLIDLGKQINPYTITAMQQAQVNYIVTSGQPEANKLVDQFIQSADQLGINPLHLLPVINEAYGSAPEAILNRLPAARIPYNKTPSDTKLWLKEQGLQKLVALAR
jgi:cellulose biosynthesis protein BcsQ